MAEYVNIRVRKDTYERLKELSAGVPLVRFLDDASRYWERYSRNNKDEADVILEQLDAQYEKQDEPAVETIDTTEWVAGVAPECCCDFYYNYNYNHKSEPCEHWKRVRWTDKNGNSKVNWYNDLINKFEFADDWKIAMKEYID